MDSTFWKAFFGGLAGRLIGSFFVAVCILLRIGPDEWAQFMIENLPSWITLGIAQAAFVLLGLLTTVSIIASFSEPETIKKGDWNIRNALEWWEKATGLKKEDAEALDFFKDLRQAASDGEITLWGRPNSEHRNPSEYTEPLRAIDKEHWKDNDFDNLRYIFAENEDMIRDAASPPGRDSVPTGNRYVDLRVTSTEVKKKWPASNVAGTETILINQKKAKDKHNLKVEHKEGHPDYQQLDIMSDGSRYWSYRISILKEKGNPIDNLQVYLSEIEPRHINIKGLPRPFHVTHRNTPDDSHNPVVRVGDVPRFFDIISIPEDLIKPMAMIFANSFPNNPAMPNTKYKLTLNIVADDSLILQKQYELVRNSDHITNYRFIEVN